MNLVNFYFSKIELGFFSKLKINFSKKEKEKIINLIKNGFFEGSFEEKILIDLIFMLREEKIFFFKKIFFSFKNKNILYFIKLKKKIKGKLLKDFINIMIGCFLNKKLNTKFLFLNEFEKIAIKNKKIINFFLFEERRILSIIKFFFEI